MIEFPSSPTDGQVFVPSGLPAFHFNAAKSAWRRYATALPKNLFTNPAMQISQENGDTARAAAAGFTYYPADEWAVGVSAANAAINAKRNSTDLTPAGMPSIQSAVTVQSGTQVGGYYWFVTKVEGVRISDLKWGTVDANQVILRFQFWSSAVGVFSATIQNAVTSPTRSYIAAVNVTVPNSWQLYTFIIPGDTTGTWVKNNTCGLKFSLMMFGYPNTFVGVEGWQAGDKGWLSNNYHGPRDGGTFKLGDVGLYADPYKTGVAPEFEVPLYEDDLIECMSYWYKANGLRGLTNSATNLSRIGAPHPTHMRVGPSATLVGAALRGYDGSVAPNVTLISSNVTDTGKAEFNGTASGFTLGRVAGILVDAQETNYVAMSARM